MIAGNDLFFDKVTILGVGLIGASFALALREKGLCKTIHGYGRSEENLRRARRQGIIDDYVLDVQKACEGADLILMATPVGIFKEIAGTINKSLKKGALVTDAGSVKGGLVYELESLMPEGVAYVGSHPIAGGDKSGIDDARPNLFKDARCIVTPTGNSDKAALEKIVSLWRAVGSNVELMDPFRHDAVYAAVSHFPHIVAYSLVNTVNDADAGYIEYAGQGFKDATRIAMSSPEMWRDISVFNKGNLLKLIGLFRENLDSIEKLLQKGDAAGLEKEFSKAQKLRMKLK